MAALAPAGNSTQNMNKITNVFNKHVNTYANRCDAIDIHIDFLYDKYWDKQIGLQESNIDFQLMKLVLGGRIMDFKKDYTLKDYSIKKCDIIYVIKGKTRGS